MLRDKQIEKARRDDSRMLIWLGKQYLGQTEKVNQKTEIDASIRAIEAAQEAVKKNPDLISELFPALEMDVVH